MGRPYRHDPLVVGIIAAFISWRVYRRPPRKRPKLRARHPAVNAAQFYPAGNFVNWRLPANAVNKKIVLPAADYPCFDVFPLAQHRRFEL